MRLLADENFNAYIVRALLSAIPDLDLVYTQHTMMAGASDPMLLEWAAQENRILLTHDVRTMRRFAYARIAAGKRMPGLFLIPAGAPRDRVLEDLRILIE